MTTACSYVTLLTTYLAKKKTMFKVSNRNTRKRCLLISKITLKTSERRHLTTSCLSEAFIPRIYTNFQSKVCFQFCFQVRRSVISTIVDPYMSFYEKWEIISKIFDSWKFKISAKISEKTIPKTDKFVNVKKCMFYDPVIINTTFS